MKECKNEICNEVIDEKRVFCSQSCAATHNNKNRKHSEESKRKISDSLKGRECEHSRENVKKAVAAWVDESYDRLMNTDFDSLSFERKRKRIIYEQESKCGRCSLSSWLGKNLIFEIDHIDGDNNNDSRENLIALCPNCHSLTGTWRGRNKKQIKRNRVSDDDILKEYTDCLNIRQTLIRLGLAPKGANYGRVKRVLSIKGISYEDNMNKKKNTTQRSKRMVELKCPECEHAFVVPWNTSPYIPCNDTKINCCSRECSFRYKRIRNYLSYEEIKRVQKDMIIREFKQ